MKYKGRDKAMTLVLLHICRYSGLMVGVLDSPAIM